MGKRRRTNQAVIDEELYTKRSRPSIPNSSWSSEAGEDASGFVSAQPKVDPNYGQRGAFPGLDDEIDEPFYGPANDGLDYLRMVRSEAKTVPSLLVAPRQNQLEENQDIYDSGVGDSRGYYHDGAYTAAPTLGPVLPVGTTSGEEDKDPQDAYYEALASRYHEFRARLRCTPPAGAIDALDDRHPISLPHGSRKAAAQWRQLLHSTDPLPAQMAAMDQQTVLSLIKFVVSGMKRGRPIEQRTSRWIWALLARLNDVGCLGNEEIAVARDLGKRAAWLIVRIRQQRQADDEEVITIEEGLDDEDDLTIASEVTENDGDDPAETPSVDKMVGVDVQCSSDSEQNAKNFTEEPTLQNTEDPQDGELNEVLQLEAIKEKMMARVARTSVRADSTPEVKHEPDDHTSNTVATIDMILTVVGDFYRQRDLLEFRDLWAEEAPAIGAS